MYALNTLQIFLVKRNRPCLMLILSKLVSASILQHKMRIFRFKGMNFLAL